MSQPKFSVEVTSDNVIGVREAASFSQYANVFNTARQAATFVAAHRTGYVVVKVGRKFVPVTPQFAKQMGLKVIKMPSPLKFHVFKPATKYDAQVYNGLCQCGHCHDAIVHLNKKGQAELKITEKDLTR
jgi:hypothetical protein